MLCALLLLVALLLLRATLLLAKQKPMVLGGSWDLFPSAEFQLYLPLLVLLPFQLLLLHS
jgi:hypothetical protein